MTESQFRNFYLIELRKIGGFEKREDIKLK